MYKKWKANIIREYNGIIFLCWIMPFIHQKKHNTTKYVYINIFSFYHNHYVVDDELQKIMSDLWWLFYMCVSINNTKQQKHVSFSSYFKH